MRQLLNQKKVDKLKDETGLNIVKVMVRGGSHDKDLCLEDGSIIRMKKDGTLIQDQFKWK